MYLKVKKMHAEALNIKTVKPQARGRKITSKDYGIENQLYAKLVDMWEAQKHVSIYVIFFTVLDIDPTFKVSGGPGGKVSAGHLVRLQKWFCFGFKRCYNLSNRKLCSVGQKLPINWDNHFEDLQKRMV